MKNGFTLVELSIVLVIIGFLIGGILVGQSLISAAKINSFVNQIQKYDAAISLFRLTYKCLPGDSDKFAVGGNCNGSIYDVGDGDGQWSGENRYFWKHLAESAKIDDKKITGLLVSGAFQLGVTMPKVDIGNKCGLFVSKPDSGEQLANSIAMPRNFYSVMNHAYSAPNFNSSPCMSPDVAASIDNKMDDGVADRGDVMGGSLTGDLSSYYNTDALDPKDCFVDGAANNHPKYNMATTFDDACGLQIRLLSSSGQN